MLRGAICWSGGHRLQYDVLEASCRQRRRRGWSGCRGLYDGVVAKVDVPAPVDGAAQVMPGGHRLKASATLQEAQGGGRMVQYGRGLR